MFYRISRLISLVLFKLLFRISVRGEKNIPKDGGFILASNHVSLIDPIAVGVVCRRSLDYMARHDLFLNPFFGWYLRRLRVFPVKRDSADLSAIKEALQRLKVGHGLVLFPEGSRSPDGLIKDAFPGIGFLAAKSGVPVIPAFVRGTGSVLPKGAKFIRLHKISVSIGKQIPIERRMPYDDIAQRIMEDIRHLSW